MTGITWTLAGTYLVTGEVTGFEMELLAGASVTVTNLRTNEDSTATVEEDGSYSVDLGDTSAGAFPSGYSIGDEVSISITHRDTTKTWKRRVAGSELVQDVHMTHGTWKGTLRKAKMVTVETLTGNSGTTLTLRDAKTTHVFEVKKNGTVLDASTWAFTRPSTITLPSSISTSDVIEIERSIDRTPSDAKLAVVDQGESAVRNATARYYTSPLPNRVPELQDISESLAAAELRHRVYSAGEKTDKDALVMHNRAAKQLEEIRNGERSLTDADGAYITPTAKSTTTPQSSTTPTRRFSRFTDSTSRVEL